MTETGTPSPRRRWVLRVALLAPLAVFLALAGLFFVRLYSGDPSILPSALIGREVPDFALAPLDGLEQDGAPVPGFAKADLESGGVSVVNVWASWCIPCREEHPVLEELSRVDGFRLYGLNYKDKPENARRFLGQYGNPFDAVGVDASGRTGIDWGVYGVPETFVVDGAGRITYKHVGPLTPQSMRERLVPEIEKARGEGQVSRP